MASYMQMGHNTENLVGEENLDFSGIILSPLNRCPDELKGDVAKYRKSGKYDIILDSQMYYPRTERGKLKEHSYFPDDLETADLSSSAWWGGVCNNLVDYCGDIGIDAVTSPVLIPNRFTDEYYSHTLEVGDSLQRKLSSSGVRVIQSVIIDLNYLTKKEDVLRIASVLTNSNSDEYYIIFSIDLAPRNELCDSTQILGALRLIATLKSAGKKVLIAFCSSDMVMFKAAGADGCGTGKFFNLRRFTKSRYEEAQGGGVE